MTMSAAALGLATLYGAQADFTLTPDPQGGTRATVRLPEIRIDGRRLLSRNDLLRTMPGTVIVVKTGPCWHSTWACWKPSCAR